MKLIIQIACLNEEAILPVTLAELPRQLDGVDEIEWLVIDDGSTDRTTEVAFANGVDYVVQHLTNRGYGVAVQTGILAALQLGADIIVNTDADNQYPARYLQQLIQPIVDGKADFVIADRQTSKISEFSPIKRLLQSFGSSVVRFVSGTDVPDAPSGYRAFSRDAALRIHLQSTFSPSLETIVQVGKMNLPIQHFPIQVNPKTRESRLMRSMGHYITRQMITLLRLFLLYEPLKSFAYLSAPFFLVGGVLWLRYILLVLMNDVTSGSNIQSVVVGAVALLSGALIIAIGLLGEIVAASRRLQQEVLYYMKRNTVNAPLPAQRSLTPFPILSKPKPQSVPEKATLSST